MYIGTAAWNIPKDFAARFPEEGSHLERYSKIFNMVEINSSFYKEHQAKTYARWAASVPEEFRFSVKLSQAFTHDCEFRPDAKEVQASLENILQLEKKLGVMLIQIPGRLQFNLKDAERFYKIIRKFYEGPLALEPRNTTWISPESQQLLCDYSLSKVIADPEKCKGGTKKILKSGGFVYYRLHGSPVVYRSAYSQEYLENLTLETKNQKNVWVVFDNTTLGLATDNALSLKDHIEKGKTI